ncbi:MAG: glycosyltransferase family 2 protein [Gammaproteobacteria bacterium]|nr:glycosyltransferase family 2 protein [Gammaproteobacteria bacterium]MDH5799847.1 glycosyltransferase family 2 protein [Gammaproteobacteria bacterium]
MSHPRVSVVLPVRNARETLDECLQSVTEQTLTNFEVIVVDDGSSDGSAAKLAYWAQRDFRLKIVSQGPQGLVNALNNGLGQAKAPYIARMDADDVMHPQRLELQWSHLERHTEVGLVACQVELFPGEDVQAGYREYLRWQNQCLEPADIAKEMFVESPLAHPSVMLRKALLDQHGTYRQGEFPEDYELWLRLNHAGVKMRKLPRVLLYWRESSERTSRVDPRYARSRFDWLRAEYLAKHPLLQRGRPIVYWGAGRKTRQRSALLINKGFNPFAWIDIDPKKIGNRIQGALVQPAQWLQQTKVRARKPVVLSYVTNHGARDLIASQLERYGYEQGEDFLMVG